MHPFLKSGAAIIVAVALFFFAVSFSLIDTKNLFNYQNQYLRPNCNPITSNHNPADSNPTATLPLSSKTNDITSPPTSSLPLSPSPSLFPSSSLFSRSSGSTALRPISSAHGHQCWLRYSGARELFLRKADPNFRYYIAINLFNVASIIGDMITELTRLLYYLCNEEKNNVFVAIYESGSIDDTPIHLRLFDNYLLVEGIPHRIVVQGTITRKTELHRIQRLAKTRNAAMRPLFDMIEQNEKKPDPLLVFDHVIFLNDILFCTEDILRLVTHANFHKTIERVVKQHQTEIQHNSVPSGYSSAPSSFSSSSTPLLNLTSIPYSLLCGLDFNYDKETLKFYDQWISRDRNGDSPTWEYPFWIRDKTVGEFRTTTTVEPFNVFCCWNGAAIINADVFQRDRVQFRSGGAERLHNEAIGHHKGDDAACSTSEISHLCEDMWHANVWANRPTYVLLDPIIAVSYTHKCYADTTKLSWFKNKPYSEARKRIGKLLSLPVDPKTGGEIERKDEEKDRVRMMERARNEKIVLADKGSKEEKDAWKLLDSMSVAGGNSVIEESSTAAFVLENYVKPEYWGCCLFDHPGVCYKEPLERPGIHNVNWLDKKLDPKFKI